MAPLRIADLEKIKAEKEPEIQFTDRTYLLICGGTGCHATGSLTIKDALLKEIEERDLSDKVKVVETVCPGFCDVGPLMVVHPGNIFYQKLTVKELPDLLESQIIQGKPYEKNPPTA